MAVRRRLKWHILGCQIVACECVIGAKTTQLSAIISLVHRLIEPDKTTRTDVIQYLELKTPPQANCQRYN